MKQWLSQEQQALREQQNVLLRTYGYHWKHTTEELTAEQWSAIHAMMAREEKTEEPRWVLLSPLGMPVEDWTILRWLGQRSTSIEEMLTFIADHGFVVEGKDERGIWHIRMPSGRDTINLKQTLQELERMRIDRVNAYKRAVTQRFRERLDSSTKHLKEVLDLHGEAMNEGYAWGYSPFPMAKRLADETIEVTTYHFEGEWRTTVCQTEFEVVRYLFTDDEGGWEPGTWV
jgi:hypothetical protein